MWRHDTIADCCWLLFLNNDTVFGFSIVAVSGSGLLTGGLTHKISFYWNRWLYVSQHSGQIMSLVVFWLACTWASEIRLFYD